MEKYAKVLTENYVALAEQIITYLLLKYLQEADVLKQEEVDEIRNAGIQRKQATKLVDIICRRGKAGYNAFLLGILACGQKELYQILADNIPPEEPPELRDKLVDYNENIINSINMVRDDNRTRGNIENYFVWPSFCGWIWQFKQGWLKSVRSSLDQALNQVHGGITRVMLIGEKYCGKSTVLSYIVRQWNRKTGPLASYSMAVLLNDDAVGIPPPDIKDSLDLVVHALHKRGNGLTHIEETWLREKRENLILAYDMSQAGNKLIQRVLNKGSVDHSLIVTSDTIPDERNYDWNNINYHIAIGPYKEAELIDYSNKLLGKDSEMFWENVRFYEKQYIVYPYHLMIYAEMWMENEKRFPKSLAKAYRQLVTIVQRDAQMIFDRGSNVCLLQDIRPNTCTVVDFNSISRLAFDSSFEDAYLMYGNEEEEVVKKFPMVHLSHGRRNLRDVGSKVIWEWRPVQDYFAAVCLTNLFTCNQVEGEVGECKKAVVQRLVLQFMVDADFAHRMSNILLICCGMEAEAASQILETFLDVSEKLSSRLRGEDYAVYKRLARGLATGGYCNHHIRIEKLVWQCCYQGALSCTMSTSDLYGKGEKVIRVLSEIRVHIEKEEVSNECIDLDSALMEEEEEDKGFNFSNVLNKLVLSIQTLLSQVANLWVGGS